MYTLRLFFFLKFDYLNFIWRLMYNYHYYETNAIFTLHIFCGKKKLFTPYNVQNLSSYLV